MAVINSCDIRQPCAAATSPTFLVNFEGECAATAQLPGCIGRASIATLLTDFQAYPPATWPALSSQALGMQQHQPPRQSLQRAAMDRWLGIVRGGYKRGVTLCILQQRLEAQHGSPST